MPDRCFITPTFLVISSPIAATLLASITSRYVLTVCTAGFARLFMPETSRAEVYCANSREGVQYLRGPLSSGGTVFISEPLYGATDSAAQLAREFNSTRLVVIKRPYFRKRVVPLCARKAQNAFFLHQTIREQYGACGQVVGGLLRSPYAPLLSATASTSQRITHQ